MKRTALFCTTLSVLAFAACDISQELQGSGNDAGPDRSVPEPGPDGARPDGSVVSPTPDGAEPMIDAALPNDGAVLPSADAATNRAPSVCVPQVEPTASAPIGTTALVAKGNESRFFTDVHDLQSGAGRIVALSGPSTFLAAPLSGGPAVAYDLTVAAPGFVAFAVAPPGTNPTGAVTASSLVTQNFATNDGQILALRGGRAAQTNIGGRVLVDGGDVFFFQTAAPSRLVQAATASNPTEKVIVEYTAVSERFVTAATIVDNYVYFASARIAGLAASAAVLHRVPRAGGPVEDLVSLSSYGQVEGIHEDAGTLFLTSGVDTATMITAVGVYTIETGTLVRADLQGPGDTIANSRKTGVAFDGNAFYYGINTSSPSSNPGCVGRLARISKSTVLTRVGKTEIIAKNFDKMTRVRVLAGKVFVGTAGDAFYRPEAYGGQVLRWEP